ncbi:unnamed protein product [Dicrocoelium dendriticum]|nr:unnamed protein product [Dicrocoelium dendriticum]
MENVYPHTLRLINKELREAVDNPIEGMKLIVNDQNLTDIQAVIDGPVGTPYEGGKFHFKLLLSDKYPVDPPKGYFHTKIFHPNVAPNTGEICVDTLKRDWKSDLGLRHVFLVIRCLLIDPNPESALNEEAGRLFQEDYAEYVVQARLFTDIHARHHLRVHTDIRSVDEDATNIKLINNATSEASKPVLRDSNGPSPHKPAGRAQQAICANKKALKRL